MMGYYQGDWYAGQRGDPFFGALLGLGRYAVVARERNRRSAGNSPQGRNGTGLEAPRSFWRWRGWRDRSWRGCAGPNGPSRPGWPRDAC